MNNNKINLIFSKKLKKKQNLKIMLKINNKKNKINNLMKIFNIKQIKISKKII